MTFKTANLKFFMNKASLIIVCVYVKDYRIDRKFHVGRIVNAMIDVTM
jgi:hypothetical protein